MAGDFVFAIVNIFLAVFQNRVSNSRARSTVALVWFSAQLFLIFSVQMFLVSVYPRLPPSHYASVSISLGRGLETCRFMGQKLLLPPRICRMRRCDSRSR